MSNQFRRAIRWIQPQSGLHVVFLGPDGAGKSTVIDAVRERVKDAFLENNYQTFARGILGTRPKKSPHELPVRSLPESLVKAAWWSLCYGPGYFNVVYPTKGARRAVDQPPLSHRCHRRSRASLRRTRETHSLDLGHRAQAGPDHRARCGRWKCWRAGRTKSSRSSSHLREGYVALAKSLPNATSSARIRRSSRRWGM